MAASYLWIIIPFTVFSGLSLVAVTTLRAHGDAKRATYPALYGAITNAVLDPIFIFALGFGLEGAATATAIARMATLVAAAWPAIRVYDAFAPFRFEFIRRDFGAASAIAVPAVLTNLAAPIGTAIVTREMAQYGAEAVAGMAIIGRLTPVAFSVVMAALGAIGPIIGQNYGGGFLKRVKISFIDGLRFIAIYVVGVALLLYLFRAPIANIFDAVGDSRELLYLFCGLLALAAFFNGAIAVAGASFENLGHPVYST